MPVKNLIVFQYGPYEWTEAYWDLVNDNVGSNNAILASQALADKRVDLLGEGCQITAIRQSRDDVKRSTWIVHNGDFDTNDPWIPNWFASLSSNVDRQGENPCLSIKVRYELGGSNFSIKSMGGFPDSVMRGPRTVELGGIFTNGANISSYWRKWREFIGSGNWGIRVRAQVLSGQIQEITALAVVSGTNYLQVTYASSIGAGVGSYVQLRNVVGSHPFSSINQDYKVVGRATVTGGVQLTLRPAVRPPAGWVWTPSGTIELVTYTYAAIGSATIQYTSKKARGNRGFQEPVGRKKKRT